MANLYVVATPIGNLEDVSLRAISVLKEVDLILCEDTRRTKILLDRYQINKPLLSYHQHSRLKKVNYILDLLRQGKNLALVSEAGTPGISDPGNQLIEIINNELSLINVIPVPGPSALTAALSVSGFPADRFIFLGFPPHKKGRQKFFKEIADSKYTVVFYESPYRIIKSLCDLRGLTQMDTRIDADNISVNQRSNQRESAIRAKRGLEVVVCRELTKKFETVYRGNILDILNQIQKDKIKGEFVVVISSK